MPNLERQHKCLWFDFSRAPALYLFICHYQGPEVWILQSYSDRNRELPKGASCRRLFNTRRRNRWAKHAQHFFISCKWLVNALSTRSKTVNVWFVCWLHRTNSATSDHVVCRCNDSARDPWSGESRWELQRTCNRSGENSQEARGRAKAEPWDGGSEHCFHQRAWWSWEVNTSPEIRNYAPRLLR